jgi:hypothetical protein
MTFPVIQACIICEAIRQEEGGKLSILGFYGVLPGLEIGAGRKSSPMTVLLITGPTEGGTWQVSGTLQSPRGEMVVPPQEGELTLIPIRRDMGGFVAVFFNEVVIAKEGRYTFSFTVDGQLMYQERFLVLPRLTESPNSQSAKSI